MHSMRIRPVRVEIIEADEAFTVCLHYDDGETQMLRLPDGYHPRSDNGALAMAEVDQAVSEHMELQLKRPWYRKVDWLTTTMGAVAGWNTALAILSTLEGDYAHASLSLLCTCAMLALISLRTR